MPSHSHSHPNLSRSKSHRSDDNLAGGRLSRRAADPTVEAERRAQQDRQFALDEAKVLNGGPFLSYGASFLPFKTSTTFFFSPLLFSLHFLAGALRRLCY